MAAPGSLFVENSQGLTLRWGTVDLGRLVSVKAASPTVATENVTGLTSPHVALTNVSGATTHHAMIVQLIAGDITPGTISITWKGKNALTNAMIGHAKPLTVTHAEGAFGGTLNAILMSYDVNFSVNDVVEGNATFQLQGL